jgi:hypothetical protein
MESMNRRADGTGFSLGGALGGVVRLFVALAAALLMVSALFVGLLIGLTLMCFALLRGRSPRGLNFVWRRGASPGQARAAAGRSGDVVDIEAREVKADEPRR